MLEVVVLVADVEGEEHSWGFSEQRRLYYWINGLDVLVLASALHRPLIDSVEWVERARELLQFSSSWDGRELSSSWLGLQGGRAAAWVLVLG